MSCLRRPLITLFSCLAITVLLASKALAGGVTLPVAISTLYTNCQLTGVDTTIAPQSYGAVTPASSANLNCDLSYSLPNAQYVATTGAAYSTIGNVPTADVVGSAQAAGYDYSVIPNWPDATASVYLTSEVSFSAAVTLARLPPSTPGSIPVIFIWTGESGGSGSWYSQTSAWFEGYGPSYTPGSIWMNIVPGESYSANVEATCSAEAYQNGYSDCYAATDPILTFNQALFDAEMGANTFPLADYYSFVYSPNMTAAPTPEPCTLLLLSSFLGLGGLLRRRK